MKWRTKALIITIGLFVFSFVGTLGIYHVSQALYDRNAGYGYFTNNPPSTSSTYNVLNNGLYGLNRSTDKGTFENFILNLAQPSQPANEQVGANFIIQAMRGGTDHGYPSGGGAAIADWEARINNPAVGLRWVTIGYAQNTERRVTSGGPGGEDIIWYNNSNTAVSLQFYNVNTGEVYFQIKEICGNAIGNLGGLPSPVNWNVAPSVSVNKTTATPGDTITWTHTVHNNGPTSSSGISYGNTSPGGPYGPTAIGNGGTISHPSTYTVTQANVGTNVCRATYAVPRSNSNGGSIASGSACTNVPYNYTLTPSITTNPLGTVPAGSTVTVTPKVTNSGPTKSQATNWQVTEIVVKPGTAPAAGGVSASAPCAYFTANVSACTSPVSSDQATGVVFDGSVSGKVTNSVTTLTGASIAMPDVPVGSKVCFVLSVKGNSSASADWRHSTPSCTTIGKKPSVQVLGGDVSAGLAYPGLVAPAASDIATTLTAKTTTVNVPTNTSVPMTAAEIATDFTGLYNTGVDASGAKLAANQNDPHWLIDGVLPGVTASGGAATTCQKAYVNGALVPLPATGANVSAQTVVESGGYAGEYISTASTAVSDQIGNNQGYLPSVYGTYVWGDVNSAARWIGINQYGTDYSTTACPDPTVNQPNNFDLASVYVYKLAGGFNISSTDNIDLNSIQLKITGGGDNGVIFVVNGHVLSSGGTSSAGSVTGSYFDANGTKQPSITWPAPGWTPGAWVQSPLTSGIFKTGNNTLEVLVKSTSSMTGLMINNFSVTANKITSVPTPQTITSTFGSWGQYGIYGTGAITGMASGATLRDPTTAPSTNCGRAPLTFSNAPTGATACQESGSMGHYTNTRNLPDIQNDFTGPSTPISGSVTLDSYNGIYSASAPITIDASNIAAGHSVIINAPNTTVTIAGDIKYATTGLTRTTLPQVVIIAGAINIQGNVQQVDSWLVAKQGGGLDGRLVTCSDVAVTAALDSNICNKQLTVHGPVVAQHLYLRRTYGAGSGTAGDVQPTDPAEIFDFRPDAYLWALQWQVTHPSSQIQTVSSQDLPPRF